MLVYLMGELRSWFQEWVGIKDVRERLRELEKRMAVIESFVTTFVDSCKDYKGKTDGQLELLKSQVEAILDKIDSFFEENEGDEALRNSEALDNMKRLRRRLRYNRTLIERHLDN